VPLYIRFSEDAEIMGPVGILRKGVRVNVEADQGEFVEIRTHLPMPPPGLQPLTSLNSSWNTPLKLYPINVLVPRLESRRPRSKIADPDSVQLNRYRLLHLKPGGVPFSLVLCGRIHILEYRDGYAHVAAEYPEAELWGWLKQTGTSDLQADYNYEDPGCFLSQAQGLPKDYRSPDTEAFKRNPLEKRMNVGDEFYRLQYSKTKPLELVCEKIRIAEAEGSHHTLIHLLNEDGSIRATHSFNRMGTHAATHPYFLEPGGKFRFAASGIGELLRAVAEDGGSIGFLDDGATKAEEIAQVYGYYPPLLLWWDRSMEKCVEHLAGYRKLLEVR